MTCRALPGLPEEAQRGECGAPGRASGRLPRRTAILVLAVFFIGIVVGGSIGYYSGSAVVAQLASELSAVRNQVSVLEAKVATLQSASGVSASGDASFAGSLNSIYASVKDSIVTVKGLVPASSIWGITYYSR